MSEAFQPNLDFNAEEVEDREAFVVDLDGYEGPLHVLLALARQVVPLYFTRSMLGSRIDLAVLKALFAEYLPQLQAHMEVIGVPLELIASKWLVGLFTQVTITGPDSGPDPDSEPQP